MKKARIRLLAGVLILSLSGHAQLEPITNVSSPDVAMMNTFGAVPVGHFTGTPEISIPLYEVKTGGYTLPLTADYHLASVKPHQQPGILGVGWSLFAGGSITRTVRGIYDEKSSSQTEFGFFGHYSESRQMNSQKMDAYLEDKAAFFNFQSETTSYSELMADEFTFNFCGYSGSFYMNENGGWTVISDSDIKLLFDIDEDCISLDQLSERFLLTAWEASVDNQRFINHFAMVTPDGCRYDFGGLNATEYSIPYYGRASSDLVATTWHLTKITTPEGRMITFSYACRDGNLSYKPSYISCDIQFSPTWQIVLGWEHLGYQVPNPEQPVKHRFSGFLTFPVYLQRIETDSETLSFLYARNNHYADQFISHNGLYYLYDRNVSIGSRIFRRSYVVNSNDNLLLLDNFNIEVTNTSNEWYCNRMIANRFSSLYLNTINVNKKGSSDTLHVNFAIIAETYRHRLLSISKDPMGEKYKFQYHSGQLPDDNPMIKTDAWGYCNSTANVYGVNDTSFIYSPPLLSTTQAETLSKIIYPTGGSTSFEYELNSYSHVVSDSRDSLLSQSGTAGGLRVRKTVTNDGQGHVTTKRYTYVNSYGGTTSSGILRCMPKTGVSYQFHYYYESDPNNILPNNGYATLLIRNRGGFYVQPTGRSNPDIGYSSVFEETFDEDNNSLGYIHHTYTNYDTDANGDRHGDEAALYSNTAGSMAYSPYTAHDVERGRKVTESYYDSNGTLLKKLQYRYALTETSPLIAIHHRELFLDPGNPISYTTLCLGWLTNTLTARNLLSSVCDTTYYGPHATASKTEYAYNSHRLLAAETQTVSGGETKTILYSYATDNAHQWMKDHHVFTRLMKKETRKGSERVEEYFEYSASDGIPPFLRRHSVTWNESNRTTVDYQAEYADTYGNPVGIIQDDIPVVLVWGDYGQCLLARFEGVPYLAWCRAAGTIPGSFSRNAISNFSYEALEQVRERLPLARVTLYRYDPNRHLESVTTPEGETLFYKHDAWGRLREAYYYDQLGNKKNISQYDYKYQTQ